MICGLYSNGRGIASACLTRISVAVTTRHNTVRSSSVKRRRAGLRSQTGEEREKFADLRVDLGGPVAAQIGIGADERKLHLVDRFGCRSYQFNDRMRPHRQCSRSRCLLVLARECQRREDFEADHLPAYPRLPTLHLSIAVAIKRVGIPRRRIPRSDNAVARAEQRARELLRNQRQARNSPDLPDSPDSPDLPDYRIDQTSCPPRLSVVAQDGRWGA